MQVEEAAAGPSGLQVRSYSCLGYPKRTTKRSDVKKCGERFVFYLN